MVRVTAETILDSAAYPAASRGSANELLLGRHLQFRGVFLRDSSTLSIR